MFRIDPDEDIEDVMSERFSRATFRQAAAKAIVTTFTFMKTVEIADQARVTYLYFETFLTEFVI